LPAIEPKKARLEAWQTAWTADPARVPSEAQIKACQTHTETLRKLLADSQEKLKVPQRWQAAETEDKWRVELLEGYSKDAVKARGHYNTRMEDLLLEDTAKSSGHAWMNFLTAGNGSFQFTQLTANSSADDILREGKLLIIQLELVRILNESKVLRLPKGGISFTHASGAATTGVKPSTLSLRDAPKDDPLRTTYPFLLQVDIDLRELPLLLEQMNRSSFNLNVTALQIDRLDADAKGDKRQELMDRGLVPGARLHEIIHLSLACEAVEFLFGEAKKGGKTP
jgi:hypothetical protein